MDILLHLSKKTGILFIFPDAAFIRPSFFIPLADAPFFGHLDLFILERASNGYSTLLIFLWPKISIVPNPTGVSLTVPAPFFWV